MAAEQTKAIVLRTIEFSETSLVVTLLTQDFGQLVGLAKGARRPKGPFDYSLDLLTVCRVVVIRKHSDALDILTEAKLLRRFRGAERSMERLYAGYYVAEMLRLLTDQHDPHPELFDLTIDTLAEIDGTGEIASALMFFDAQALKMLGHAPATRQCCDCGTEITPSPRMTFSVLGGGVVCPICRPRQRQSISVRRAVIEEMDRMQSSNPESIPTVHRSVYGEMRAIMNRYIQSLLGNTPRMQAFLPTAVSTESQG